VRLAAVPAALAVAVMLVFCGWALALPAVVALAVCGRRRCLPAGRVTASRSLAVHHRSFGILGI
ncbi:MAG: hypothetical protein ACRDPY_50815, partial [Streptosporangiaceae bacterium]